MIDDIFVQYLRSMRMELYGHGICLIEIVIYTYKYCPYTAEELIVYER